MALATTVGAAARHPANPAEIAHRACHARSGAATLLLLLRNRFDAAMARCLLPAPAGAPAGAVCAWFCRMRCWRYYYCYTGLHSRLGCWPGPVAPACPASSSSVHHVMVGRVHAGTVKCMLARIQAQVRLSKQVGVALPPAGDRVQVSGRVAGAAVACNQPAEINGMRGATSEGRSAHGGISRHGGAPGRDPAATRP